MEMVEHGQEGREAKAVLRRQVLAQLEKISTEQQALASAQIRTKLPAQVFWKNAAAILFYAPLSNEVDLWPLLQATLGTGKVIALPCFNAGKNCYVARRVQNLTNDIVAGKFGVREPNANCVEIPLPKIDLVLAPGIAFDLRGNRLGRGKGFYDQLLKNFCGVKCGIAFDEQILTKIPTQSQDIPMNFILSPTREIKTEA
jgi:5-formyltetrahydrofolate cyclo-ligase